VNPSRPRSNTVHDYISTEILKNIVDDTKLKVINMVMNTFVRVFDNSD